jgi:hypothetical protein
VTSEPTCDCGGWHAVMRSWTGSTGSARSPTCPRDTAADHVEATRLALAQLPGRLRRKVLVRT